MAAHWVQLQDEASGAPYFYNQLTARTQWVQPVKPEKAWLPPSLRPSSTGSTNNAVPPCFGATPRSQ